MKKETDIFKSLIAGGVIGGALGTILSKNQKEGFTLGAIAGAVLLATYEANQIARKSNVPLCVEENGAIYEISPNGERKFIREVERPTKQLPKKFLLK